MSESRIHDAPEQAIHTETVNTPKTASRSRRYLLCILLVAFGIWLYTLWATRVTPITQHGSVNGQMIHIAPQVSGTIASIAVIDNVSVKRNYPLFSIESAPFQLDVEAAQLALQQVAQSLGGDSTALLNAKIEEVNARVSLAQAKRYVQRNMTLARMGVINNTTLQESLKARQEAKLALATTIDALNVAENMLDNKAQRSPQLKTALNTLDHALLNLSYTKIIAPDNGVITNMRMTAGDYVAAGQPVMTYIDTHHFWLTAMVQENSLTYLRKGTIAKMVFDVYPGKVFHGEITSIGWGNDNGDSDAFEHNNTSSTLQQAQRYPVNIRFFDLPTDAGLRYGSQATVGFYPKRTRTGEALLDVWMWTWSKLSYVW
ncbi:HlyD family secretion protein [Enterovibrio baiacu]|uniref:HlyD family secretion protein n=1 Tax=Enterovibrio baiacu TaxID=2491023 RepID=UPI001011FBC9|nr:HlyD family secretion protein [Enterovibrio baiacu]MBE1275409.1 HlyD family secretion protein [Enterovibrio baiacu]